ncbi:hypothetical protein SprV_0501767100 [Sparganum proliferum]
MLVSSLESAPGQSTLPPSDWLADAETTKGAHALGLRTSKAATDNNNLPGERAGGDCPQSLCVRTSKTVKVVQLTPSSLTFDWESLPCRPSHFRQAKWLFRKLGYTTSEAATTVCPAAQFMEQLKGMRLNENEAVASFNVASLHFDFSGSGSGNG